MLRAHRGSDFAGPLQSAFQLIHMGLGLGDSDFGDVPDGGHRRQPLSGSYQVFHLSLGLIWYDDSRSFPETRNLHHRSDFVSPLDHVPTTFSVSALDERVDLALEFNRRLERFAI